MKKSDIVNKISDKTGIEKVLVTACIHGFMNSVMEIMEGGENVYLRGFGTFVIKERKAKTGQNIKRGIAVEIPAHCVARFKPSKTFAIRVKKGVSPKGR